MTVTPSLPCSMPDAESVPGTNIELARLDPARHGSDLWHAIGAMPSLWQSVPPGPFATEAEFRDWLVQRAARTDQVLYALIDRRDSTAEGLYFLINIESAVGRAEMGLVLGSRLSRRTAGTEAFYLLARYVFETLSYRRLEWRCNPENEASMRAADRFGFTLEGVLRQNTWLKGRNWDTAVYAILDREWPAVAARFVRWLAPDNFDSEGRQIKALLRSS